MFSLIITIISIALVAALAVATIYYGGSAFTQGSSKALASTLVSQAQQVAAAEVLYANDHAGAFDTSAGLTNLTAGGYLTAVPTPPSSLVAAGTTYTVATPGANGFTVSLALTSTAVCSQTAVSTAPASCSTTTSTFSYVD